MHLLSFKVRGDIDKDVVVSEQGTAIALRGGYLEKKYVWCIDDNLSEYRWEKGHGCENLSEGKW